MNNHWPDAPAPATSVWETNMPLQCRFVSKERTDPFPIVKWKSVVKTLQHPSNKMDTYPLSKMAAALLAALCLTPIIVLAENAKDIPVKHFIYIIQENITFDHYFGTFPGADGIPKDVKLSYEPGGERIYAPFHLNKHVNSARLEPQLAGRPRRLRRGKNGRFHPRGMAAGALLLLERSAADGRS